MRAAARAAFPLLTVWALAGCTDHLDVTDPNNPPIEELEDNPNRAVVASAVVGLMVGGRDEFDDRNGYVSLLGILGRESYNFDGSEPRFITEMLESELTASSPAFGGNLWGERYANIRLGATIIAALDRLPDEQMTDQEKAAVRGFVRTLQAHELLLVTNTRDTNGIVIDFDQPADASPAPLAQPDAALARVAELLDQADADLEAAGAAAFPFPLSSGFAGFDTPETFRQANRALRVRVAVYQGDHQGALDIFPQSFGDTGAPLDLGIYHAFGTGSGDDLNELFDPGESPQILAHPSIVADAELRANGQPDLRLNKVRTVPPQTAREITTDRAFSIYNSAAAPIPIIRNEELILLRAEALIGTNQIGLAAQDINFIRENSGGLAPRMDLTAANIQDELLRQRRYSLLFEGGHRWIDMRRFGRLEELPLDQPNHIINARFPIPEDECLARGQPTC